MALTCALSARSGRCSLTVCGSHGQAGITASSSGRQRLKLRPLPWRMKHCAVLDAHVSCPLSPSSFLGTGVSARPSTAARQRPRRRAGGVCPVAMVNVDLANPALLLGGVLIGCGVLLLQMRQMQKRVSRDGDIVVAAMISIVGGTLIFQGWRLDPLLLLSQAMTISIAFWYGLEAFKLRSEKLEEEDRERRDLEKRSAEAADGLAGMRAFPDDAAMPSLPAGDAGRAPWGQEAGTQLAPEQYAQLYQQAMNPWGGSTQGAPPATWGQPEFRQYSQYDVYSTGPPVQVPAEPYQAAEYPPAYTREQAAYDPRYPSSNPNSSFPYPPQPASQNVEPEGPTSLYDARPAYDSNPYNTRPGYQLPGADPASLPAPYNQPQSSSPDSRNVAPAAARPGRNQGPGKGKFEGVDDWE